MGGISKQLGTAAIALFGICAASAVSAQSGGFCAGAGDEGTWIGGDEENSDIATADFPYDSFASVVAGGRNVTLFRVSEPAEVRVEASPDGTGDTIIDLISAAGDLVLNDDDGGGGLASAGQAFLAPGTYCLITRSFDPADLNATLRIGLASHTPLLSGAGSGGSTSGGGSGHDPCTSSTTAFALTLENGAAGATNPASEVPYYRFSLEAPAALTLRADSQMADPYIFLYDANGGLIDSNDDYEGLNSRIDANPALAPGEYCVAVTALSDPSAPITFAIAPFDAEQALRDQFADGTVPPPLDGSHPVEDLGLLSSRAQSDAMVGAEAIWYLFEVSEPGLLVIEAVGVDGGDPKLVLYDELGRFIEENDDSGRGLDAKLAARVFAGRHLLALAPSSSGSEPSRMRLLIEEYAPR